MLKGREMKTYKTFEEWSGDCHLFNSHEDRNLKLFQAGQSWPDDKIKRAKEILDKYNKYCPDYTLELIIKILEE